MLSGIKRRHPEGNETTTTDATLRMDTTFVVKRICREDNNIILETYQNNVELPVSMETEEVNIDRTIISSLNQLVSTSNSYSSSPPNVTQRCLRCAAGEPGHIQHILQ